MSEQLRGSISRRDLLRGSLVAGGTLLLGFDSLVWPGGWNGPKTTAAVEGELLGTVEFSGEAQVPMETVLGAGLDGRKYTDLGKLTARTAVTPTERFYVRTQASALLQEPKNWAVSMAGLVTRPTELPIDDLKKNAKPMGVHLMECSGNSRSVHFGLMSAAEWAGVPLLDVLGEVRAKQGSTRVRVSGFDEYPDPSASSVAGASWIFGWEELKAAGAFLAMEMNGSPLTRDHGSPVRLVVPGWYGCASIKWLNEVSLVEDAAETTSQMREFAERTHQKGVPKLARDYEVARIDQAAMPIRVEKWLASGKLRYRIVGILWGGRQLVKTLEIRFNPEEDYVAVENFEQKTNDPWSFWTHTWTPKQTGSYLIRLRVKDPQVVTRRLDAGYYMRSVEIREV